MCTGGEGEIGNDCAGGTSQSLGDAFQVTESIPCRAQRGRPVHSAPDSFRSVLKTITVRSSVYT